MLVDQQVVNKNLRPDLFIGLVGAAGTDLDPVKSQLKAQLASFGYKFEEIKLSKLIGEFCTINTQDSPEDERIKALMDGGDRIRSAHQGGDGVVCLAVTAIRNLRGVNDKITISSENPTAYIIDSLKNPSEIQTLTALYGRNFYTISVYSSESNRKKRLSNRIAKSCTTSVQQDHKDRAEHVIREDERRNSGELSQDVQNTFPKADFFVEAKLGAEVHIKRFVELIFGEPFITPTLDEYAMFLAKAASLRSCDLSRQIGAVIIDDRDAIVSTGCNDVPYPGGGMYYEGRVGKDNRDHTIEFDPNSSAITDIVAELVTAFRNSDLLSDATIQRSDQQIVTELLHGDLKRYTIDTRVRNLIEFGRVVHAEMHALSDAARLGRSVANARLFSTTFPCHICARHIIAAGIREVVFIEPYPKSLTKSLYEREISTDDKQGDLTPFVTFRPFQGVAPVLYQRAFAYRPRKDKAGTVVHLNRQTAIPVGATFVVTNPQLEENLSSKVDEIHRNIHKE